jgi:hypothetical protein
VRYVLVGGLALVLHGGSYATFDADLAIAFDAENRRAVARALAPLSPQPMRLPAGASWEWDELCIRAPWSIFNTDAGRVDLLVRLPGVDSFQGLYDRSVEIHIAGAGVRVASLEDLISMKQTSQRTKDQLHLLELEAIKRVIREEEPT